jgi:arylsulfatase A-like enzyme
LEATAHTDHPDFVPQAVEMFDSPRTGDVIVFAAEGWGICENVLGGHGSSSPAEMRMPLFFAGPGLKGGTKIPCGRVVDMAPTLMGLLGESQRLARFPAIDGVDLSDELLQAD